VIVKSRIPTSHFCTLGFRLLPSITTVGGFTSATIAVLYILAPLENIIPSAIDWQDQITYR
jgi:hypothetical protein